MMLTSCFTVNKHRPQVDSVNDTPTIRVPFENVDIDGNGNITKDEYEQDARTLDVETPGSTTLGIMVGVGLLVGILIFLTTCYKGPSGIRKD